MVFLHVNHCYQWFFNGFFTCESLVSMVFGYQPLVSMVFTIVFYNRTIAIAWMVCGSPLHDFDGLLMVLGKMNAGSEMEKRKNIAQTQILDQK